MTWADDYAFEEPFVDLRRHPEQSASLAAELARELAPGHVLYQARFTVVARALPQDEVVVTTDSDVALVHMTWIKRGPDRPPWPMCQILRSAAEFEDLVRYRY